MFTHVCEINKWELGWSLIYSQCQEYMVDAKCFEIWVYIKTGWIVNVLCISQQENEESIMELILDATANEGITIRAEDNILLWRICLEAEPQK
jgi:hypothetical protein